MAEGRGFTRDTLLYGAGVVLARLLSFLTLPIYTRFLSPADYGVLQLVQMAIDVTAILLSAGLTSGVMRFYLKAGTADERHAVVSTAFVMLCVLNAAGGLLLAGAAPWIAEAFLSGAGPDGPVLLRIVAVTFFLEAFVAVPMLLLQAERRAAAFTAVSLVRLALQVALNVTFLVVFDLGVRGILLGTLCANALVGSALVVFLLRRTGLVVRRSALRDLRRFGVPQQLATAGTFLLTFGDRLFLERSHGLAAVGLYGLAYQFGFLLHGVAAVPFFRAWSPRRLALSTAPRAERDRGYRESLLELSVLTVGLAVAMGLGIRPALSILAGPEFQAAATFVPVLLAAVVLQVWTDAVSLGIEVSEQTRFTTLAVWISAAVTLALYAILIPPHGGAGAAAATLVGAAVRFALTLAFSQRLWPVDWGLAGNVRLLALGALAVAAGIALAPEGLPAQIGVAGALFAAFATAAWALALDAPLRARLLAVARLRSLPGKSRP